MKKNIVTLLMLFTATAFILSACGKTKQVSKVPKTGQYTGEVQSSEEEIIVETETAKVEINPEVLKQYTEYSDYLDSQTGKINAFLTASLQCQSFEEYKAVMDQVLNIVEETRNHQIPDENEELYLIMNQSMNEVESYVEDSLKEAESILPATAKEARESILDQPEPTEAEALPETASEESIDPEEDNTSAK